MYYEGKTYDSSLHDVVSKDKTKSLGELCPDYYRDMPERIWETHAVAVGVCNSLNARRGMAMALKNDRDLLFFEKVQGVITELLYETGRYEEYDKWLYEYKQRKNKE